MEAERSLDPTERRIVGVLIEKELTTPAQYPLSLNGLVTGCNQKNNREPVTAYAEFEVEGAFRSLYVKGWACHATGLGRVVKHQHRVEEQLELDVPHRAVLAELLLRGAQQPGALRTRSARMAPTIAGQAELMEILDGLRGRGLVACLGRRSGERAERWAHTLASEEQLADELADGSAVGTPSDSGRSPTDADVVAPSRAAAPTVSPAAAPSPGAAPTKDLRERVDELEARVAALERRLGDDRSRDPDSTAGS